MKKIPKEKFELDLGYFSNCNDAVFFPFVDTWERDVEPLVIDRPDFGKFDEKAMPRKPFSFRGMGKGLVVCLYLCYDCIG